MPTAIATIDGKTSKAGNTNGRAWVRYSYNIGDLTMSSFDAQMDKDFQVGDLIEVIYSTNGKYHNIDSMIKKDGGTPTLVPTIQPANTVNTTAPVKSYEYTPRDYEAEEASKVAGMIVSYCKDLVVAGKIEAPKIQANAEILADVFKHIKKRLLNKETDSEEKKE